MSSLQLYGLKFTDNISKTIIKGFIRGISTAVPIDIINLCLLFYVRVERFHPELHGDHLVISNSGKGYENTTVQNIKGEKTHTVLGAIL